MSATPQRPNALARSKACNCAPRSGTAQERAGNYKEAVKAYKVAIDLEPEEAKY